MPAYCCISKCYLRGIRWRYPGDPWGVKNQSTFYWASKGFEILQIEPHLFHLTKQQFMVETCWDWNHHFRMSRQVIFGHISSAIASRFFWVNVGKSVIRLISNIYRKRFKSDSPLYSYVVNHGQSKVTPRKIATWFTTILVGWLPKRWMSWPGEMAPSTKPLYRKKNTSSFRQRKDP